MPSPPSPTPVSLSLAQLSLTSRSRIHPTPPPLSKRERTRTSSGNICGTSQSEEEIKRRKQATPQTLNLRQSWERIHLLLSENRRVVLEFSSFERSVTYHPAPSPQSPSFTESFSTITTDTTTFAAGKWETDVAFDGSSVYRHPTRVDTQKLVKKSPPFSDGRSGWLEINLSFEGSREGVVGVMTGGAGMEAVEGFLGVLREEDNRFEGEGGEVMTKCVVCKMKRGDAKVVSEADETIAAFGDLEEGRQGEEEYSVSFSIEDVVATGFYSDGRGFVHYVVEEEGVPDVSWVERFIEVQDDSSDGSSSEESSGEE